MVKKELSERYYSHYVSIINNPEDQDQTSPTPAQAVTSPPDSADLGKDEPAISQSHFHEGKNDIKAESVSLDENLASINEVTPIRLKLPASERSAAELATKNDSDNAPKKKFCFIATAAYGSPMVQEVVLLQNFRDDYLSRNSFGKKFIRIYYRFSPYLAKKIGHNKVLKLVTRFLLTPIIFLINKSCGHPDFY